ncbi:MAG: hypothetical protein Q9160_004719 [Pyrenula sp. 1 TL-2023]
MAYNFSIDYPWTKSPLIVSAPMMKITMASLATAVSLTGGLGFLAAGFDTSHLNKDLEEAAKLIRDHDPPIQSQDGVLPIGVGFQNWGSDPKLAAAAVKKHVPAAVWFFAPTHLSDLLPWAKEMREATAQKTKVWVQVGSVAEAMEVATTLQPDVLVIQGSDAGGHGLQRSAGLITLLPEVAQSLGEKGMEIPLIAGGGIVNGRGMAAALALGAHGITMGTRFLAAEEAVISKGYQGEVLRATDGGVSTVRTKIYDVTRKILDWPKAYDGRGIVNRTYQDHIAGMPDQENIALYGEAMKQGDEAWGPEGRMTTYAGTGVGLVTKVQSAAAILEEVWLDCEKALCQTSKTYYQKAEP